MCSESKKAVNVVQYSIRTLINLVLNLRYEFIDFLCGYSEIQFEGGAIG